MCDLVLLPTLPELQLDEQLWKLVLTNGDAVFALESRKSVYDLSDFI